MLKVIKYAENRGRIEGKAEGRIEGIAEGKVEGIEEGQLKILKLQLTRKFGPLSPEIVKAIDNLDQSALEILSIELISTAAPSASSIETRTGS